MAKPTILISGAGVAGPTLAYWLARAGFAPTIVERSGAMRSSGSPVDVRGPSLDIATRMGLLPRLREAATRVEEMTVVDDSGRIAVRIGMNAFAASDSIELPRGDLATILHQASRNDAETLFGDQIVTLAQDATGVDVTFEHADPRRFDLVIGADGLHSRVRKLAFGPEPDFVRHMGLYVATLPLSETPDPRRVLLHNSPGRALAIHPARGHAIAAFIFRHPAVADYDYRDDSQHKAILAACYAGEGWRTPELLEAAMAAPDLYFDAVSMVSLDSWSKGRVALLGDAASCLSLFGEGSSLAIAGAYRLAMALAESADHATAFARYESEHRRAVMPRQKGASTAAALIVPKTRFGIAARNFAANALSAINGLLRLPDKIERLHAR